MAGLALKEKTQEVEPRIAEMDPALIDELAEIVARAEDVTEGVIPELAHWYYRVPCPGVRYYSYHE